MPTEQYSQWKPIQQEIATSTNTPLVVAFTIDAVNDGPVTFSQQHLQLLNVTSK
jgi:hypothetical protein